METPNLLKGYMYPSSRVCRCPRFHACIVSKKCQNYDGTLLECVVCETRTNEHSMVGGYVPEGEYYPDMQDAIHTLEETLQKAMAHPDTEGQVVGGADISNNYLKERKAADMLATFMNNGMSIEEQIVHAMVDPKLKKLLGRME